MGLHVVAWVSLGVAVVCALVIVADEVKHPQAMSIMNVVWPISALYFSVFAVWAYFTLGRRKTKASMQQMGGMQHMKEMHKDEPPTAAQVAVGTSHCGAGCAVADVLTEFSVAAAGIMFFGSRLTTEYILDLGVAWLFGIAFQYFAIKPMRQDLSVGGAIVAAIKADTLSIIAFQVGMYAFMALVYFRLFTHPHLEPFDPRYWLMMQIAMVCGFATSFPMNRFLIGTGLKEKM